MDKPVERRYVLRKYVMAISAADALSKDSKTDVQDVFVEEDEPTPPGMGFKES